MRKSRYARNMRIISFLLFFMIPAILAAAPMAYDLDRSKSKVQFIYFLEGRAVTGTIPIQDATVLLDAQNISASKVLVNLDTTKTRGGLIFDTEPLRGPGMLDVANFPTATFVSSRFSGSSNGAQVSGKLTIKGRTRSIALASQLLRQAGSDEGDLSRLVIRLNGRLNRTDYNMNAMENLVDPGIELKITVYLNARP